MIQVPLGEEFRLPHLGMDGFKKLMAAGLEYDSKKGFRVKRNADLVELKMTLRSQLGEEVEYIFSCFVCDEKMSCKGCEYHETCSIERTGRCICENCMKLGLKEYQGAWRRLLASSGD